MTTEAQRRISAQFEASRAANQEFADAWLQRRHDEPGRVEFPTEYYRKWAVQHGLDPRSAGAPQNAREAAAQRRHDGHAIIAIAIPLFVVWILISFLAPIAAPFALLATLIFFGLLLAYRKSPWLFAALLGVIAADAVRHHLQDRAADAIKESAG